MSDPFATVSDLQDIWRPLTPAEMATAAARITQASEYIRQQFRLASRDVDAEISAGKLAAPLLRGITVDMVHRIMLNPNKLRSSTRSIDDYQRSDTLDNAISAGDLYLTDNELALLGLDRAGRGKAFSIRPDPGPALQVCWPLGWRQ